MENKEATAAVTIPRGAGKLQGLVFLTILMTVGIQGLTAQPLAKMLGLLDEDKNLDEPANTTSIFTES